MDIDASGETIGAQWDSGVMAVSHPVRGWGFALPALGLIDLTSWLCVYGTSYSSRVEVLSLGM